ncbi:MULTISPECIES: hypothetical protein [Bacillus]|uniref:Group-specific protein n=1 Tax=Bacillus pseudomycoides TaxID=64104 RepID=A0A1Y3MH67_9BACI|nr:MULTISPECIES: hypothetical protein [Bacillus cereus group]EOP49398.1 hypothetical protein IIW_03505 [Bacillus cereus VD136]EOP64510.1 hypothetical protein KOW_02236 [Bacillus cereus VDM006]EOQ01745.1 hypothetical protein KOY_02388 [Bacillus cereus VDM021]OOG90564.1 hypothetical protein BTH41_02774 [Bacillus mycoides]MDF2086951.1 hypothetical protein [Bacillus pseudomycoides]
MKQFLKKLYEHIEIILLVCLSVSFLLGVYTMINRTGDPTTMDYVAQAIIGTIIIGDVLFLIRERKKKIESEIKSICTR